MHNLRHFYYQNKEKIWKVVLIIAFLLGIIYFLNAKVVEDNNKNLLTSTQENINYSDEENNIYISDKSAINAGSITQNDVEKINNTISKFLQYCKNEKFEEAYNMVSTDCKEKNYKTLEKFVENYVKVKFNKTDVYEVKSWLNRTYRVSITEDILSTGKVESEKKQIEYITIVEENSQDKLNINSYIGQTDIQKETIQDNIKITVKNKETYLDYEIYNFKIENLSNKTIKLDALEKTNTMYLMDRSGYKYNAYRNELLEEELVILPKRNIEISIKYSNSYALNKDMSKIIFSNLILDYEEYEKETEEKKVAEFIINL